MSYAHQDVIDLLYDLSEKLLNKAETKFIGKRLHLIAVEDGETRTILNHPVTFFDIHSNKAKQFGWCMDLGDGEKLTCCGDEPCSEPGKNTSRTANGCCMKPSACTVKQISSIHMKSSIPR